MDIVDKDSKNQQIWMAGDIIGFGSGDIEIFGMVSNGKNRTSVQIIYLRTGKPLVYNGRIMISQNGIMELMETARATSPLPELVRHYPAMDWNIELTKKKK